MDSCWHGFMNLGTGTHMLITCCIGTIAGLLLAMAEPSDDAAAWIGLPGNIFLRVL